jgi:hypothetical protein
MEECELEHRTERENESQLQEVLGHLGVELREAASTFQARLARHPARRHRTGGEEEEEVKKRMGKRERNGNLL